MEGDYFDELRSLAIIMNDGFCDNDYMYDLVMSNDCRCATAWRSVNQEGLTLRFLLAALLGGQHRIGCPLIRTLV